MEEMDTFRNKLAYLTGSLLNSVFKLGVAQKIQNMQFALIWEKAQILE